MCPSSALQRGCSNTGWSEGIGVLCIGVLYLFEDILIAWQSFQFSWNKKVRFVQGAYDHVAVCHIYDIPGPLLACLLFICYFKGLQAQNRVFIHRGWTLLSKSNTGAIDFSTSPLSVTAALSVIVGNYAELK